MALCGAVSGAPSTEATTRPTYADLRAEWQDANADFRIRGETECLSILGAPVMEDWESPYMAALAEVACCNGGRVLEIGFGLGISSYAIDAMNGCGSTGGGVTEHVIIEANRVVAQTARQFAESAQVPTRVIEGFWQDAVEKLPAGEFSGILFDVFPLQRQEVIDGECDSFFASASRLLAPGGTFTFYFDVADSWIATRRVFNTLTTSRLHAAGFAQVSSEECECIPPADCEYFWKDRECHTGLQPALLCLAAAC